MELFIAAVTLVNLACAGICFFSMRYLKERWGRFKNIASVLAEQL